MKINEIIIENLEEEIVDEWSQTSPGIRTNLEKKGYKFLGKGVDQSAFLEPGTRQVLKIFGTQPSTSGSSGSKYSEDQKMFIFWAEFCQKNANNPVLPKFSGFEKFVFNRHTYFQIRQEKLQNIGGLGKPLEYLSFLVEYDMDITKENVLKKFQKKHSKQFTYLKNAIGIELLGKIAVTCLRLYNIAVKNRWVFDLHSDNFMLRADGTPVIVDPWHIAINR